MKSPGTRGDAFKRKCIAYDVLEKDVTKKKIYEFDSIYDAAKFLGMTSGHVSTTIRNKCRHKNKKLNKLITIR